MKRAFVHPGMSKVNSAPSLLREAARPWASREKLTLTPQAQSVWTRYVESRLKQFGTR